MHLISFGTILVEMNSASVSSSASNTWHDGRAVPRTGGSIQRLTSGCEHQQSPLVYSVHTDILRKVLAVSQYVIEKKCGSKEVEEVLLILGESEFDVGRFIREVKDIRKCRQISSTVFETF